jgi:hypothetical protein
MNLDHAPVVAAPKELVGFDMFPDIASVTGILRDDQHEGMDQLSACSAMT